MSFSLGVDIEEVARFKALARNRRFLARVFTRSEVLYCAGKKNRAQHLAVRFAAKEAVWKAMSELLRAKKLSLSHRDIGVRNDAFGKPRLVLPKRLSALERRVTLTLSHSRSYAVAVALVHP